MFFLRGGKNLSEKLAVAQESDYLNFGYICGEN